MENIVTTWWNRNKIILKSFPFVVLLLAVQYGFVFTLIQLQDYALLMSSIGLFITLALVMYFSRKIKWNS